MKQAVLKRIAAPHWATVLSSILIVAAFPPWDLRYLIWIALVPWFFALTQMKSWREALGQGIWLSIAMTLLGFHWVAFVLHNFGDVPWIVAILGLCIYSLVGQPQFLLIGPIFWKFFRTRELTRARLLVSTLALGLIYAGTDWLLPKLFQDTLGHAFYSASWLRQSAELAGAEILTFVVVWFNFIFFLLLEGRLQKKSATPLVPSVLSALIFLIALATFGYFKDREWRTRLLRPSQTIQAGVIQANIGDFEKVAAERGVQDAAEKILGDYLTLSEQAISLQKRPDFIVWPETAYASTYRKPMTTSDFGRDARIEAWVRNKNTPLLFGSYDRKEGHDFNAFFLLSPHPLGPGLIDPSHSYGDDVEFYHKNILLTFGEYIPFQDQLPFLGELFPQVANFGRGSGPHLLQIPIYDRTLSSAASGTGTLPARSVAISPVICYEVLFSEYVREGANRGSQLIMNITNDSWFGPYGEPHLHLALSTFRSIEDRLPMIRSTNTGFSALITPDGEIVSKSHLFEPEILNVTIPILEPGETLFKKWGEWFPKVALIAGLIALAYLRRKRVQSDTPV